MYEDPIRNPSMLAFSVCRADVQPVRPVRDKSSGCVDFPAQGVRRTSVRHVRLLRHVSQTSGGHVRLSQHVRRTSVRHVRLSRNVRRISVRHVRLSRHVRRTSVRHVRLSRHVRRISVPHVRLRLKSLHPAGGRTWLPCYPALVASRTLSWPLAPLRTSTIWSQV